MEVVIKLIYKGFKGANLLIVYFFKMTPFFFWLDGFYLETLRFFCCELLGIHEIFEETEIKIDDQGNS